MFWNVKIVEQGKESNALSQVHHLSAFNDVELAVLIEVRIVAHRTEHTRCMG
jgi:hypothetical protein